jgi:hypothetical protein
MERVPIKLRENELARLIKESTRDNYLSLRFGPAGASLDWWKSTWALPIIAEMRGLTSALREAGERGNSK